MKTTTIYFVNIGCTMDKEYLDFSSWILMKIAECSEDYVFINISHE